MVEMEKHLKAIANKRRLAILKQLKRKPKVSVSEIARMISLSFRATSRHLRMLATLNILEYEQKGLKIFYSLNAVQRPEIKQVISLL